MWSTFVPYVPNSNLPGAISFVIAVLAVTMVIFLFPLVIFYYVSKLNPSCMDMSKMVMYHTQYIRAPYPIITWILSSQLEIIVNKSKIIINK